MQNSPLDSYQNPQIKKQNANLEPLKLPDSIHTNTGLKTNSSTVF